ncbi:hypothetical protein RMATCC62417_12807 [Rhizopus microsporus]|nr:hypothetical protein RMATCC62417_12807 [Rhizopus microsporus]
MLYTHKKESASPIHHVNDDLKKKKTSFIKYSTRRAHEEQYGSTTCSPSKYDSLCAMMIEDRIRLYQEKYKHFMEADTQLRTWINTNKQKGPPLVLKEAFPCLRPRMSSISTPLSSSKRKSLLLHSNQEFDIVSPAPKASFSTFLKKAMRPSDSTQTRHHNKSSPHHLGRSDSRLSEAPKPRASASTSSKSHRFFLSSSFNRLSLLKQPVASSHDPNVVRAKVDQAEPPCLDHQDTFSKRKQQGLPAILEHSKNNNSTTKTSKQVTRKNTRPQSTIVPYSPSSVFLDRLQRDNLYEERECQMIQPNTYNKTTIYATVGKKGLRGHDNLAPSHCGFKDLDDKEDILNEPRSSKLHRMAFKSSTVGKASARTILDSRNKHDIADQHRSTMAEQSPQKKRISFSLAPSLSSLRFMPQKSSFLKRQSMLA